MATGIKTVEAVGVTIVGVGVGALIGGPVGAGIGLAAGAIIDVILLRHRRTPFGAPQSGVPGFVPGVVQQAMVPGGQSLPPGADTVAASKVTALLLLAAGGSNAALQLGSSGPSKFVGPAKSWLGKFQASVGMPVTGALDAQTRALLVLATTGGTYDASKLPATTILG